MPRDLVEFPEAIVQPQVPAPIDPVLAALVAAKNWYLEDPNRWVRATIAFKEGTTQVCVGNAVNLCAKDLGIVGPCEYFRAGWEALGDALTG